MAFKIAFREMRVKKRRIGRRSIEEYGHEWGNNNDKRREWRREQG